MRVLLSILFSIFTILPIWATNYYVATDGNDSRSAAQAQNINTPWATWAKAFTSTSVNAGDTVFIRGGVYNITVTSGAGIGITRAGTSNSWIVYSNYPGETPILDCTNAQSTGTGQTYNVGVSMSTHSGANYIKLKGLTVRNIRQYFDDHYVMCIGFDCNNGEFIYENCVAHDIEGVGFSSGHYSGWPNYGGHHYYINCDAYECSNPTNPSGFAPGQNGTGFDARNDYSTGGYTYRINCRAWRCGDQGFNCGWNCYIETDGCWSFNNGIQQGDGHGYKLGWSDYEYPGDERLAIVVRNCLAAYNRATGINTNETSGIVNGMNVDNNTCYYNSRRDWSLGGFWIHRSPGTSQQELLRIFRNNISYDNGGSAVLLGDGASYTHSNNSWDGDVTITAADFKVLPATEEIGIALLSSPRQADGSLPDLGDYFKLAATSDAIDAGTNVGLPYNGFAPDLGAFEYGEEEPSDATDIITFTFPEQTGSATINTVNHTVSIEVEWDAVITSLTPTITVSGGATIDPTSGTARNFTSPVTYTVTAEDTVTEQEWTVTVTQEAEPSSAIKLLKKGIRLLKKGTKFLR